jgi:hypothetical protein
MSVRLYAFLVFSLVFIAGCKTSTPQPPTNAPQASSETNPAPSSSPNQPAQPVGPSETAAAKPKIDACALLTSKEIETVQGEAVKETKLSGQSAGGHNISQCFFTLPTFNNSVSLLVAQKGEGAGSRDPRDFWRETFHENKPMEREEKEEKEESAPPKKVRGIGDEAFWLGSRVGGAIYVLKGNAYVRISIGGAADQATKMAKSKSLAQKALARL